MEPSNHKLNDEEFFRIRKEILSLWPTGKEVDLGVCRSICVRSPNSVDRYDSRNKTIYD